jgi:WD40 repeat protein
MSAAEADVHRTLEYAHLHRYAIACLPIGLLVCLWGLYLLTPLDGSGVSSHDRPVAWLILVGGASLAVFALLALRRPNRPALSLSAEGIVYWPISAQPIPWSEIQHVEVVKFVPRRQFFARTVTAIVVSKEFYERINGSYFGLADYVEEGPPVKIRILHFLVSASFNELHDAVVARWRALGDSTQRARRAAPPAAIDSVRAPRPGVSSLRLALSLTPLLGIALLLANQFGLWSTQAQREARHAARLDEQKWAEIRRVGDEARRRSEQLSKSMDDSWKASDAQMKRSSERQAARTTAAAASARPQPGGHRDAVLALAVAPDRRRFLSAGADRAVKLWETASSVAPRDLGVHKGIVRSVHFLSEGAAALAAGDDGEIILRALSDGRVLHVLRDPARGDVAALALSADGRRAVSVYGSSGGVVWSMTGRIMLHALESDRTRLQAVAISPDGGRAIGGGDDGMLRLWDIGSGKLLRTFGGHQGPVYGLTFTHGSTHAISAGGDSTLRLWDVETGNQIRSFAGHTDAVYGVAVSGGGRRILSGSLDRTARLWDIDSGNEIARFSGHMGPVYAVAFAGTETILTGSADRSIRSWKVDGRPVRVFGDGGVN